MHNVQDLNTDLSNLAMTFDGIASKYDRDTEDRIAARERAQSYGANPAYLPDPDDSRRSAGYYRHCASVVRESYLYIDEPPPDTDRPQQIKGYWEVTSDAVAMNRAKFGRESDPWKVTQMDRPRGVEVPAKPVPTEFGTSRPSASPAQAAARGHVR